MHHKHLITSLAILGLFAGLMVVPAASIPSTLPNGQPFQESFDHPVFGGDWNPIADHPVFDDSPLGNEDEENDNANNDRPINDDDGNNTGDNCHTHEGSSEPHCPGEGDHNNSTGNQTDPSAPGCQPGEVHIPEDTDCDGEIDDRFQGDNGTGDDTGDDTGGTGVTEERHVTPAPEPESVGEDWISYPNPRDHMPNPSTAGYDPSIKICAVMLNQANEVITGHTVPDTQVEVMTDIPRFTDDTQPVTFNLPIDQAQDLIGTDPALREGDGMLDAECGEYHNLPEGEYSYGAPSITGADSDQVEFVGVTEYWDATSTGDPFHQQVFNFGENELSDGHIPTLTAGNYEQQHAEVVYMFRLTNSTSSQ